MIHVLFIVLVKFRQKLTKEMMAEADRLIAQDRQEGINFRGFYWTLGRYDGVTIAESPDEKTLMKALLRRQHILSSETMIALTREEAMKLIA